MLFQGQYWFYGTHASRVKKLIAEFDDKHKLFSYNHEIYQLAPIIGFLYGRKAELNKENGEDTSIFPDQISGYRDVFLFNYQLIMLLDEENAEELDARIDKAFRLYGTEKGKADKNLYESYVRGGVDVLYEKLIENSKTSDDYIKNLYTFMADFNERYIICTSEIADLCSIARS